GRSRSGSPPRGQQVIVRESLLLLVGVHLPEEPLTAEEQPRGEPAVGLDLVRAGRDLLPQLGVAQVLQQEGRADDAPGLAERLIQPVAAAGGPQPAQQQRKGDGARLDGEHHLEQVRPVRLDEVPVDRVGEETVEVLVARLLAGSDRRAWARHRRAGRSAASTASRYARWPGRPGGCAQAAGPAARPPVPGPRRSYAPGERRPP